MMFLNTQNLFVTMEGNRAHEMRQQVARKFTPARFSVANKIFGKGIFFSSQHRLYQIAAVALESQDAERWEP